MVDIRSIRRTILQHIGQPYHRDRRRANTPLQTLFDVPAILVGPYHMTTLTYLDACLTKGRLIRWPDHLMPLNVYIAPFQWYEKSKQRQSWVYHQLALEAMKTWQEASRDRLSFRMVTNVLDSQINVKWRRIDRKSLGHCQYEIHPDGFLFSAEIQIGISDGVIHKAYDDISEVRHTILHEFGHALGLLGHSDHPADIMYVPHQYGVHALSPRDVETFSRLYSLPSGFSPELACQHLKLPYPHNVEHYLRATDTPNTQPTPAMAGSGTLRNTLEGSPAAFKALLEQNTQPAEDPEKLLKEQQILSQMGQFYLQTSRLPFPPKRTP